MVSKQAGRRQEALKDAKALVRIFLKARDRGSSPQRGCFPLIKRCDTPGSSILARGSRASSFRMGAGRD